MLFVESIVNVKRLPRGAPRSVSSGWVGKLEMVKSPSPSVPSESATVIVAVSFALGSAWLAATTRYVPGDDGAVYRPSLLTAPPAAPSWTVHDTVAFEVPVTDADSCTDRPGAREAVRGDTTTVTVPPLLELPPLPLLLLLPLLLAAPLLLLLVAPLLLLLLLVAPLLLAPAPLLPPSGPLLVPRSTVTVAAALAAEAPRAVATTWYVPALAGAV
jgi:hypothetical protein